MLSSHCPFNTRILLIVLLEYINLLHFYYIYKLYICVGPEPTIPTLGYMQLFNITITIEIVYEVDLTLQIVSMSVLQG